MAIEKMTTATIIGSLENLDETIFNCIKSGVFHPEILQTESNDIIDFSYNYHPKTYTKYINILEKCIKYLNIKSNNINMDKNINLLYIDYIDFEHSIETINIIEKTCSSIQNKQDEYINNIEEYKQAILQINHLISLDISFDDIFACKNIKVRFGRLPVESYTKLSYHNETEILFTTFDKDSQYYWGVYFTPIIEYQRIDNIMKSMLFERIRVPDYIHGLPENAIKNLNILIENMSTLLKGIQLEKEIITNQYKTEIIQIYNKLLVLKKCDSFKQYVCISKYNFYIVGFLPYKNKSFFNNYFKKIPSVSCIFKRCEEFTDITPPVKLKNLRIFKPFESFVSMYGVPKYNEFDPTVLVAITYILMFGAMFGDLGQGAIIFIIGIFLSKFKQIEIGKIFTRIGVSSMAFGTLYGSVFGIETLFDPIYKQLFGLDSKPIHLLSNSMTNNILVISIITGGIIIGISMIINIYTSLKNKDFKTGVFGPNGCAGFILYIFIFVGAFLNLTLDINIFNNISIIFFITIPLLSILFREPLAYFLIHKKFKIQSRLSEFLTENIFELFEIILSYITNTMSFLRVGGFILTHAGMMVVVLTLTQSMNSIASPIALIIGNLLVIAVEGLIVGIQVLRLEFYEIFSRFFSGKGKPYKPFSITNNI